MDEALKEKIKSLVKGDVADDPETLKTYSHDNSLVVVKPELVVWPKDSEDIKNLVKFVAENKSQNPNLSLTVRAAGSCMSGGPINESIIVDVSKYFNKFSIDPASKTALVEPGVFYRDFEVETLKNDLILPCYTASKNLCALGGMIGNNAAGEKTLQYGKMENYVEELTVVLRDGEEHVFKSIHRSEALNKAQTNDLEGEIYEKLLSIIGGDRALLAQEKPKVSKNSAGYYLWNVEHDNFFDLTRLLVGSQGTLGIITKAKIKLVPVKKHSKLFVIFLKDLKKLGEIVNVCLKQNPESIESYDDATFKLAVQFLPELLGVMKAKNILKLGWSFLPELGMVLTSGLPKLVMLVELAGHEEKDVNQSMDNLEKELRPFHLKTRRTKSMEESEKYWTIRRESFNLLRKHVRGKRTAPFVDDVCVRPEFLPEFLPKLRKILDDAKIVCTIAGHAGNGNFHIIPLMDMKKVRNRELITEISDKVYDLVHEYEGTITAEHNDGLIRTPYLSKMFSGRMLSIFAEVKHLFDPENIFNPNKKVPARLASESVAGGGGSVQYLKEHLAKE